MVDLLAMADRDLAQSLASLKPSEAFMKTQIGFLFSGKISNDYHGHACLPLLTGRQG